MDADSAFTWFTWIGVLALGIGVICACGVAISGKIRDDHLKIELANANLRVATAQLETERLKARIAPRHIQEDEFLAALAGMPTGSVELVYVRDDPETFELAQQIWRLLETAKWTVEGPTPIAPITHPIGAMVPTAMSLGGQPSGVSVVTNEISQEEWDASRNRARGLNWVKTSWTVLWEALGESLGRISGGKNKQELSPLPPGVIRIIVAPKG